MPDELSQAPRDIDLLDALMALKHHLQSRGLKELTMTLEDNERLRVKIDYDVVADLRDQLSNIRRSK